MSHLINLRKGEMMLTHCIQSCMALYKKIKQLPNELDDLVFVAPLNSLAVAFL